MSTSQHQRFGADPQSPPALPRADSQGGPNVNLPRGGPKSDSSTSIDTSATSNADDAKTKEDKELAERLSILIEDANSRLLPLCKMIRSHIENMEGKKEEDRNEDELIKQVKPLIQQADQILQETNGAIKGADPGNRLSSKAQNHAAAHTATPEEQRLAAAIKVLVEEVGGTIEWAKGKLDAFPKAKRDLGPLLDALGAPLTQIVSGVCMLLTGVLNLVGKILSGLGLDSFLHGLASALGLKDLYKGMGLDKMMGGGKGY
ncbi:hypothetical protein V5O48_004680 [Marasmius crinis-equi]|uniref:DUF6987 domain-containing protein n=1 Tax=Marasmius crinis-equi TaxID=585013 RepID=A0ABR3FPB4_9AGAR